MHRETGLRVAPLAFTLFVLGVSVPSLAQEVTSAQSNLELTVPEPVRGVEELIAPTLPSLLSAALSNTEKGTQIRVAITPSEAFGGSYTPGVSELTLQVLADSSDTSTRLSLSSGYNPFLVTSGRVTRIIEEVHTAVPCKSADNNLDACQKQCKEGDTSCEELCNIAVSKERKACIADRAAVEWAKINSSFVPAITTTVFFNFFPGGKKPLPANPAESGTVNFFAGGGTQLALSWRACERLQADLWGTWKRTEATVDPGLQLATTYGGGATVAWNAMPFLDAKGLKESEDYVRMGFIPGLGVGASFQMSRCLHGQSCEKGRTSAWSLTPFVDVRASPKLQVRLSVPITSFTAIDTKTGADIAPTVTVGTTVGSP